MPVKDKMMCLRIPESLVSEYKKFCEDNSFTLSKRIRKLMENDLYKWKKYQHDNKKSEE